MPTSRPVLNVALDEDTYEALGDFCVEQGVSAAALFEAFARAVTAPGPVPDKPQPGRKPPLLPELVRQARLIAGERKRRRARAG